MPDVMGPRWSRGDVVIVRYPPEDRMTRAYLAQRPTAPPNVLGWPHLVLSDGEDCVALYMPEGTPLMRWYSGEVEPRVQRLSVGDSVLLFFPGKRYMVTCWYEGPSRQRALWVEDYFPDGKPEGRFHGWKVDLQSPFARTEMGVDMIDEVLDLGVRPDRTYYWRDEDEMAGLIALGVYTAAEAEDLRQVGREAIALIERGESPFNDEWKRWSRPADLVMGKIPEGWQHLPVPAPYRAYQPWTGLTQPRE